VINFICDDCKIGAHDPCENRNADKHTSDCDCQHVVKKSPS